MSTANPRSPESGETVDEIVRERVKNARTILKLTGDDLSTARTSVALVWQDDEITRLTAELSSAREETAQAVRAEIEACAVTAEEIGEDAARLECSPAGTTRLIANAIRFRASLPGETADA